MHTRCLLLFAMVACKGSPPPVHPMTAFGLRFDVSEKWDVKTSSPDPRVDLIEFVHKDNADVLSCTYSLINVQRTTEGVLAGAKLDMGPTDEHPWLLPTKLGVCTGSQFTSLPPSKPRLAAVKPQVSLCTMEIGARRLLLLSMTAKSPSSTPGKQLEALVACQSMLLSATEVPAN